jgi:hypothetical protein
MKVLFLILLFLINLIAIIQGQYLTWKDFYDMMNDFGGQNSMKTRSNQLIFLKIKEVKGKKKNKKRNLNKFAYIISEFLKSLNMVGSVYNINNEHFVIITKNEHDVDANLLKEHFSDIIDEVGFRSPGDFMKEEKKKDEI